MASISDRTRAAEPAEADSGLRRITTVAIFVGAIAAVVAGATVWLLLTDPVAVAQAVEAGEVTPLVRQLADLLYDAFVGLLEYF